MFAVSELHEAAIPENMDGILGQEITKVIEMFNRLTTIFGKSFAYAIKKERRQNERQS